MEVRTILAEAWQAVESAGIPDALQVTAFEKAVDLLAAKNGFAQDQVERPKGLPLGDGKESDTVLGRIAKRLEVDIDIVSVVYDEENGEPRVAVANRKIDAKKQTGTRQLAVLVAAGRQAGIPEETTLVQSIRDVATDYKRYDQNNFQKALQGLDHIFQIRGRGSAQTVKLSKPGWAEAAQMVRDLGSADS